MNSNALEMVAELLDDILTVDESTPSWSSMKDPITEARIAIDVLQAFLAGDGYRAYSSLRLLDDHVWNQITTRYTGDAALGRLRRRYSLIIALEGATGTAADAEAEVEE